jgi:hypothetical protein
VTAVGVGKEVTISMAAALANNQLQAGDPCLLSPTPICLWLPILMDQEPLLGIPQSLWIFVIYSVVTDFW